MSSVLELTDSNYTSFMEETDSVVFIDFYSDTCPPCQTLLTYLPNLAEHYKDEMVKKAEVGLLGIDGYFKMLDKEIGKGRGFFSNFLRY